MITAPHQSGVELFTFSAFYDIIILLEMYYMSLFMANYRLGGGLHEAKQTRKTICSKSNA